MTTYMDIMGQNRDRKLSILRRNYFGRKASPGEKRHARNRGRRATDQKPEGGRSRHLLTLGTGAMIGMYHDAAALHEFLKAVTMILEQYLIIAAPGTEPVAATTDIITNK